MRPTASFLLPLLLTLPAAPLVQDDPSTRTERLPELSYATFDDLWEQVVPSAEDEAWRDLEWRTTFWQGVIDAQEADKPILLFTMNGHPFGCT